jgi:RimJ/RimL family protein N-acetyltransferase
VQDAVVRSWPLFDLLLVTPRLTLRLGRDEELDQLARASAGRVLPEEQAEFMDTDWTQLRSPDYERSFMQFHWQARADWKPDTWSLQLIGFDGDTPIGGFGLMADDFARRRSVKTGSWLLPDWRRRGLGTEGRAALLHLAFAELGAIESRTDAHPDNAGSRGVSRTLGYEETGRVQKARPDGHAAPRINLRLSRQRWEQTRSLPVEIIGLDSCRAMFCLD